MSLRENNAADQSDANRYLKTLDIYGRVLSGVLMLFGLRQWAIIVGVAVSPGGEFEAMTVAWQLSTMYLAVIDLVAAVGLWMRVAWGKVLWICAAMSEVAFHTVFIDTFGSDFAVVAFHLFAVGGLILLALLVRNEQHAWPFHKS
jgi:hypothetical protein